MGNNAATPTTAALGTTDLLIPVQELANYPNEGVIWLGAERIHYTSKSAASGAGNLVLTDLTGRGYDGSTTTTHVVGEIAFLAISAILPNRVRVELEAISNIFTGASAFLHGLVIKPAGAETALTLDLQDQVGATGTKWMSFQQAGVEKGNIQWNAANNEIQFNGIVLEVGPTADLAIDDGRSIYFGTAHDIRLTRQAASIIEHTGAAAGSVRWGMSSANTPFIDLRLAAADANPAFELLKDRINAGAGGASALDTTLFRQAAGVWAIPDGQKLGFGTSVPFTVGFVSNGSGGYFNNVDGSISLPSGASDMGASINAAQTALPSYGGEIVVPPGSFSYATAISISKPGVRIRGHGRGVTTLTYTGAGAEAILALSNISTGQLIGLLFTDFTLNAGGKHGIHYQATTPYVVTKSAIERVTITNANNPVYYDCTTANEVYSNFVRDVSLVTFSGSGIYVNNGVYNIFERIEISSTTIGSYAFTDGGLHSSFVSVSADCPYSFIGQNGTATDITMENLAAASTSAEACFRVAGYNNKLINPVVTNVPTAKLSLAFALGKSANSHTTIINPRIWGASQPNTAFTIGDATTLGTIHEPDWGAAATTTTNGNGWVLVQGARISPVTDTGLILGTNTRRLDSIEMQPNNGAIRVWLNAGDSNPMLQVPGYLSMGAGGNSVLDTFQKRQANSVYEITGGLAGSIRYGMSGAATPFLALRAAAADANALAQLLTDRVSFGPGGASAVDVDLRRTGANAMQFTATAGLTFTGDILASSDAARSIGTSTNRFLNLISNAFLVYGASGDANPVWKASSNGIQFGPGGATATDVQYARQAASVIELTGSLAGSVRYGMSGASTPFMALRNAAADTNPMAQLLKDRASFGPGGASAVDAEIIRASAGIFNVTGDWRPTTDNNNILGGVSNRWKDVNAIQVSIHNLGEVQPLIAMITTGLALGPGGATVTDNLLARQAASVLELTGSLAGSVRYGMSGANAPFLALRNAAADANPLAQLLKDRLSFGVGGATGVDLNILRVTGGTGTYAKTDQELVASDASSKGIILKDNQGSPHYWRVFVDSTGHLTTTDLGTALP